MTSPLLSLIKGARLVDLSVLTGENQPSSPPEGQRFGQFMMNRYDWPRGYFLEYVQVHDDHTGTHCDAPCHMIPPPDSGLPHASDWGRVTIDQLDLNEMIGAAVVVDCRPLVETVPPGTRPHLNPNPAVERDYLTTHRQISAPITRAYLEAWEAEHGRFQKGEIVLFRTDWSDLYFRPYPEGFKYDRSHPAPAVDAIELLHERGIRHIGIDGRGIGQMQDDYSPHWAALGHGMIATENLTNLGQLPVRGAVFIFLPHKFQGATGGLGRAVALVP